MSSDGNFDYALTIRGITERIAFQLGDSEPGAEFDGYDEKWITARIRDTFKWLQGRRPDLFGEEKTFTLKAGARQEVPDECEKLIEILSVKVGGKTYPVFSTDFKALQASRVYDSLAPECATAQGIYHVAINDADPRSFLFSPPVAPGKPVSVTATCSDMNRFFKEPDKELDCDIAKWINTVIEYVLYQAYSMDGDNPVNTQLADAHRSTFFDLAPVQRREQSN